MKRLLLILLVMTACSRPGEAKRERFVGQFLASVRDETAFFRGYMPDPSKVVDIRRRYPDALTGGFRIIHREDYGDGTFDYGTECGPNLVCVVYLTERGGSVLSADITIDARSPRVRPGPL
jgi:hypothetical protein